MLTLGLAYGAHGLKVGEVASMPGVSPAAISSWKKTYIEEGGMETPKIGPKDIEHPEIERLRAMTEGEAVEYIRQLEIKNAVL